MFKKIVLFALALMIVGGVAAQENQKIAHFNTAEVIMAMPEYTAMMEQLQKQQQALEAEMKVLEDEYNKKYTAFMEEAEGLVESIKTRRLQEIQDIEQRAMNFNQQSQQQLQQLQQSLLTPIQQKVKDALDAVSVENKYTYVLEIGNGTVIYMAPTALDATPQVKKKLGI